jgi:hypothetical protein
MKLAFYPSTEMNMPYTTAIGSPVISNISSATAASGGDGTQFETLLSAQFDVKAAVGEIEAQLKQSAAQIKQDIADLEAQVAALQPSSAESKSATSQLENPTDPNHFVSPDVTEDITDDVRKTSEPSIDAFAIAVQSYNALHLQITKDVALATDLL